MNYLKWGYILSESNDFAMVKKYNFKLIYHINIYDIYYNVQLKYKDNTLLEFTDTLLDQCNLNSFTRTIKNQEYIFIDGNDIFKKIKKKTTNFLKPILPHGFISYNIITMNLETRTIDDTMIPYCISVYDGKNTTSFT
jgi:hypothetical protein